MNSGQENKGQVSLEFLLILAVFFSSLLLILPAINYSSQQIMQTNDIILSKQIYQIIEKDSQSFQFLADGTRKEFEFIPTKEIRLETQGKKFIISTTNKTFSLSLSDIQKTNKKDFTKKFKIIIEKTNNKILISFY